MTIKIEIPESDIRPLIEFYRGRLDVTTEKINRLFSELELVKEERNRVEAMLTNLQAKEDFSGEDIQFDLDSNPEQDEYGKLLTWDEKIRFALTKLDSTSTTTEIVAFLENYERGIKDKSRSLSAVLSEGVKDGKFYKVTHASGYPRYGLREWEQPEPVPEPVTETAINYFSFDTSDDDLPF